MHLTTPQSHTFRIRRPFDGFTLIELLTVIAIIGILAAIIIPTVGKVRETARVTQSISNMRQIGTALNQYLADYKNMLPAGQSADNVSGGTTPAYWSVGLNPYVGQNKQSGNVDISPFFQCPIYRSIIGADPVIWRGGYSMNNRMSHVNGSRAYAQSGAYRQNASKFKEPSRTVFASFGFWEAFDPAADGTVAPDRFYQSANETNTSLVPHNRRIGAGSNGLGGSAAVYLMLDGSVKKMSPEEAAFYMRQRT
jgi:prepilin-type N-terminal cleavage/methylation domain-containing protein